MKNYFNKALVIVLGLIMALSMYGCTANGKDVESSDSTADSKAQTADNAEKAAASDSLNGKRVAFISPANQFDFFVYIGAEVKKVGEENGIKVDSFDANLDVAKLSDLMTQAILQKYDAIIVAPVDTEALIPSIQEANEAGIPVINYDSFVEGADVYARVGSGNSDMGKTAGEHAIKLLKEKYGEVKGKVIVLSYPALETMNKRIAGFKEALKEYPDIVVKEETVGQCTAEGGQKLTDDLLIANAKNTVDIIYGSNAGVVLGSLASVSSAGRDEIALIGIDNEEGQLNALKDGKYYKGTVAQNSYAIGDEAIKAAMGAMKGKKIGDVVVPGILVTPDNVEEYLSKDQTKKAELASYK